MATRFDDIPQHGYHTASTELRFRGDLAVIPGSRGVRRITTTYSAL